MMNRFHKALWAMLLLLCASAVSGQDTKYLYSVPTFSLVLKVNKSDHALIVFQDRLEAALRDHLTDFFTMKIGTPDFGNGSVEEVALASRMVWKELTDDNADFETVTDPGQQDNVLHHYEVRADYQCQIALNLDSTIGARLSEPMVDLMMIEAFQGDNYWYMFHIFLSDTVLSEIDDVKVTVIADGFQPNPNKDMSSLGFSYEKHSGWTKSMKVGMVFAGFFGIVLVLMWVYLFLFVNGTFVFKSRVRKYLGKDQHEASTEPNSDWEYEIGFGPEESAWMDAWARSITSIPVREPVKIKRKKNRRPSKHFNSSLDKIEESDDDESWGSSEESDYGDRLSEDIELGDRLTDNIEFEDDTRTEGVQSGPICQARMLYEPSPTEMVEFQPQFQLKYEYGTSC